MSKKKKNKDFWNMTSEEQIEGQNYLSEMEDRGDVDIFSLGKIPKHYTGVESEIMKDISNVFGNKSFDEERIIPEDTFVTESVKESESFIASLKSDNCEDSSDDIHFDPTMAASVVNNKQYKKKDDVKQQIKPNNKNKVNNRIYPIRFRYNSPILTLNDSIVSLYYKMGTGEKHIRYVRDDIVYDDSVIREVLYLIKDIIAFRHPTAIYKPDEFDAIFDEVKGVFIDADHESKYFFIDFDDYITVYYFGDKNLMSQLDDIRIAKSNIEAADIIMGLTVESLDFNLAFMHDDFERYYNSDANNINKKAIVDLINKDIEPSDTILMLDVEPFKYIFNKSETIIEKYLKDNIDDFDDEDDSDNDSLEDAIKEILGSDDEDDDLDLPDDNSEDDDDEDFEDEEDDDETDASDNIDDLIDEAAKDEEVSEDTDQSKPIDKVVTNNHDKDHSMVIEVTRKTHA